MHVIGLAGPARSGKDTIANFLAKNHGYQVFSFSDALYREVADAFAVGMPLLKDAATKDKRQPDLALKFCCNARFLDCALDKLERDPEYREYNLGPLIMKRALSPRWVLQTWGTEFRRAQDPDYWLERASDWVVHRMREAMPDMYRVKLVNTSVRFPNEADWIRRLGGEVWHVRRRECPLLEPVAAKHSSETPLPIEQYDTVIYNNGSVNSLWTAITMRMGNRNLREVRVEGEE